MIRITKIKYIGDMEIELPADGDGEVQQEAAE
jgi:hypothetical protein